MAHKPPIAPGTLLQKRDIELALGVGRSRAHQITASASFPAPVDDGIEHRKPIWAEPDIRAWAEANEYNYPKENHDRDAERVPE